MNKISVIIPAYNAEGFIAKCIKSIQMQTYQNFEVVVVDDGSTDSTLSILKKLAKEDDRLVIVSQTNQGVSGARNTAMKNATGEFITMVDADDDLPVDAFENMVSMMEDDVDFVIGSHLQVRLGKKPYLEPNIEYVREEVDANFRSIDPKIWFPWAKLFRRSVIVDNKIEYDKNISYGEDHIFNLSYIKNMKGKIKCTSNIVYNYYFIRGGLCAKYYPNMHELQRYVLDCMAHYFDGYDNFPTDYKNHYIGCYLLGCFDYYISWCKKSEAIKKVKESFAVYDDIMNEDIWNDFFSESQIQWINDGNYQLFVKDYIRHNRKKTTLRKYKRKVRRVLEYFLKIGVKIKIIK